MTNFVDALELLDEQIRQKVEFRLYYNKETGELITYTMEDLEGDYILINKDEFAEMRYNIIVKDGKIQAVSGISIGKLVPLIIVPAGLEPGIAHGTLRDDVSIAGTDQFWRLKTYE